MTATAMPGTGRRHRVVASCSGFGRVTATKALKHAETDKTDTLTFVTRIAARGMAHVHNQTALWLHVIPTTAECLTVGGAFITLYIAIGRRRPQRIQEGWR
jgi:hypothetical protein